MMIYTIDTKRNWAQLLPQNLFPAVQNYRSNTILQSEDLVIVHTSDCNTVLYAKLFDRAEAPPVGTTFLIITGGKEFQKPWPMHIGTPSMKFMTCVPYFSTESDLEATKADRLREVIKALTIPGGTLSSLSKDIADAEQGKPEALCDRVDTLTRTIHSIQNVFLPIVLDAQTLRDCEEDVRKTMVSDIYGEHFGSVAGAYLSGQSQCHNGTELVAAIETMLTGCFAVRPSRVTECFMTVSVLVRKARKTLTKPPSAGGSQGSVKAFALKLQATLAEIGDAGNALVEELRAIRVKEMEQKR